MMNQKILSTQELYDMKCHIAAFYENISAFYSAFDKVLRCFENQEVVQSFYESGILGSEQRERLILLRKSVGKYIQELGNGSNSLVNTMKHFIDEQTGYLERTSHVRKAGVQE
ncbi:MAG: hypothetical protein Q4E75_00550 [bacterium]|nr:hypothetical protein [bacterium]